MSFTIELDYEMVDKIVWKQLEETRDMLANDLEEIMRGAPPNIFVWGDDEVDLIEIHKHIDALNLLIEWYRIPEY